MSVDLTKGFCTLFLSLQQQHLIELIRLRETEAALEFAQAQLAEQGEESRECLTEMERTLALLAFDNPEDSPFGDLLNMMQRQKVWAVHYSRAHICLAVIHFSSIMVMYEEYSILKYMYVRTHLCLCVSGME